jgi:hypothetical protein
VGRLLGIADGVIVDHALNRANNCMTLFEDDGDSGEFERVLMQACEPVAE